ncbi:MAG: RNA polymerase sigma factor [Pseudohongiella sp.]|nr:RNA polymerase sigma factor [Pseudohongiella sp.]
MIQKVLFRKDNGAFGKLVSMHQSHVRGFLRRLCKNNANADDLAQDTFVIAFRQLAQFNGSGSFGGWLMSIAYRCFLQDCRQHSRLKQVYDRFSSDPDSESYSHPDRPADNLDMERAMAKLDPIQAAAITLNLSLGYSHTEVSKILGLPLGTAKSHINRGLDRLRAHMNDSYSEIN